MQFDQDGHSEVQHQLLITLVHGTWGRGFFPSRQRQRALWYRLLMTLVLWRRQAKYRDPFWFEEGSPFLARLSDQLGDIPHNIWPLLWSGANSIFVRDKTARALSFLLLFSSSRRIGSLREGMQEDRITSKSWWTLPDWAR
jgi:hypothetical protein